MNAANFKKVLDFIKKNPKKWSQKRLNYYKCPTCFAGICYAEFGAELAWEFLDVDEDEYAYLIDDRRKIKDFEEFYNQKPLTP